MKTLWLKEDDTDEIPCVPNGVQLSETETLLLTRLADQLSLDELINDKDFTHDEARKIQNWADCIGDR